ncbi:MAG: DUF2752 domain-containing protein [Lentisphaeria bacterium]|nr:DUF2752 domain-containing protein [Lentisphaeria bacterium]
MKSQKGNQAWLILLLLIPFVLMVYLHFFPLGEVKTDSFYPKCKTYQYTGLYCGGCGMTRATNSFFCGEIRQSLAWNPFFILLLVPIYLWSLSYFILKNFTKIKTDIFVNSILYVGIVLTVLLVTFSILRNLPYESLESIRPHKIKVEELTK